MFDELVGQARRLFSSKHNAGKQVPKLTDRLHTQKQVLLAVAIILLLGHSQFRDHFECQAIGKKIDKKTVTNFCLINGTTTVVNQGSSDKNSRGWQSSVPHVGLHFVTNDSDYRVINHNYMRSLWALLILLVMCSYFAQKNWATLFDNDVLQALLQLTGSSESRLVRAADNARPYEMLSLLSSNLNAELSERIEKDPKFSEMTRNEKVMRRIDIVDSYVNIYDHKLDYYPNQLTYLLLTKNAAAYNLSCLKLRRKLIICSIKSTLFTLLQFILPLVFIGNEYLLYGWRYLIATVNYLIKLFSGKHITDNSIDYELSSRIFPTSTQCEYQQYGMVGSTEKIVVQCTVAINEICSKLFVVIWWFVVVNIIVELYSLAAIMVCSLNLKIISWSFGLRFWPHAREQANLLASFRYKRSLLLNRCELIKKLRSHPLDTKLSSSKTLNGGGGGGSTGGRVSGNSLEERVRFEKKLEAEGVEPPCDLKGSSERSDQSSKQWYLWCTRDICMSLADSGVRLVCCHSNKRRKHLEQETAVDMNVYYLLYLIYLRLGKSKSKVEEVIRMTACALNNYLVDLEAHCDDQARVEHTAGDSFDPNLAGNSEKEALDDGAKVKNVIMMC